MTYYPYRKGQNTWLERRGRKVREWEQPIEYDPNIQSHRDEIDQRLERGTELQRTLVDIAGDLFEYEHPDKKSDRQAREQYIEDKVMQEGDYFGRWLYFQWDDVLVQYPERDLHRELLTYRNRGLLTPDEQRKIGRNTIAYAGLSVGSNVAVLAAHLGMGDTVILADPDSISQSNLNRLPWATMRDVGSRKTDALGIHLSELDPYVEQHHFSEGITDSTTKSLMDLNPDLIYEHTDSLDVKVQLRKAAERLYAPLIMATDVGDVSLIDVERHDFARTDMLLGRVSTHDIQRIENGELTPADYQRLVEGIVGKKNISKRMKKAMKQIGKAIAGYPQYGTTAMAGGAYATVAGRGILLGRGPATGRYVLSPRRVFGA